jgi:TPR repeat protein
VLPDRAEALRWFERAAEGGDARAMRMVASLKTDAAQRVFWLRRSLELDFDPKTAERLITALDGNAEALVWLERLSDETADPDVMMRAHDLHMRKGISDQVGWIERAIGALRARVERGDMKAARILVTLLEAGQYTFEEQPPRTSRVMRARPEDALALLEGLAASGQIWAMDRLEGAFRHGDLGLERDPRREREWLLKQVELRDSSAIRRYTDLLLASGEHPKAIDLLRRELARDGLDDNDQLHFRRLLGQVLAERPDLRQPGDPGN